MKWLDSITDSMDMNLSKLWDMAKDGGAWCDAVCGVAKGQTRLSEQQQLLPSKPMGSELCSWDTVLLVGNQMTGTISLFNCKPGDTVIVEPKYTVQNNNENGSGHCGWRT